MRATTCIILDTRKALQNGKYPVKLRVTYARKQKYFSADLSLTKDEFDQVNSKNPRKDFKTVKLKLAALEERGNMIISSMDSFDFTLFSRKLLGRQNSASDVYGFYDGVISEMKSWGSLGNAVSYTASRNSLRLFQPKLQFREVTVDFLDSYERWLLKKGKSVSTVGIYLRPLRAILNRAIAEEIISKDFNYPFGSRKKLKYQIPTSRNTKKSLTLAEIKLLFGYTAEKGSWEEIALDFWKFSYLANGMNMKDVSQLRYKDIDGEYIRFVRAKSARTSSVVTPITVFISDHIRDIIDKWGDPSKMPASRIFAISKDTDSPEKQRAELQQFIKMVNKYIRIIARNLGIDKPVTTYYARHSFSTVLKRSGANVQQISEALGHSSILTTRSYLDSFEDDSKKEMAKALTAF